MERIEKFTEAIAKNKGKQQLNYLLNFLTEYAEYHFESEEGIMEKYGYEDIHEHRKRHMEFFDVVNKLKNKLGEEGSSDSFALDVQRFLIDWLILHVKNMDKKMAEFQKEKKQGN
ncbi:MAG: bacteriohemerythrin [Candidatus Saliniplasma sp.]